MEKRASVKKGMSHRDVTLSHNFQSDFRTHRCSLKQRKLSYAFLMEPCRNFLPVILFGMVYRFLNMMPV